MGGFIVITSTFDDGNTSNDLNLQQTRNFNVSQAGVELLVTPDEIASE